MLVLPTIGICAKLDLNLKPGMQKLWTKSLSKYYLLESGGLFTQFTIQLIRMICNRASVFFNNPPA
ncbi:MAG TPA: hypothetical protein DCZ55_09370 [Cyanobacteria bacterium UBA11371]|nr:hypothetical protein [Cyanobacteria bacterium UBA11371]